MVCVSNAHDLWPFAFLFSSTAAAPRIYCSTTVTLQPRNCFELLQVFATSPVAVFNLFCRGIGGDDGKRLLLAAWNTAMHESTATCAVQQRSHPIINLRSDPNASVPGGNPQSSSFEEAACTKTNPERAYGKAQSRGDDANTVLEVISGFLLYGVSASLEQCVFMLEGKRRLLEKRNKQGITDTR